MKNILLRSFTGLLYIAVILCGLLLGTWSMIILCMLLCIAAMTEFYQLSNKPNPLPTEFMLLDMLGGCALILFALEGKFWFLMAFLAYVIARLIVQLYSKKQPSPLSNLAFSLMSQLYISFPLFLMAKMHVILGPHLLTGIFVMIWLNDTGAYLIGCKWGRHRLFERISPKKSWEGFFGGFLFSLLAGAIYYFFFSRYLPFSLPVLLGLGALVSVFATWGDLVESMIKRSAGVKDSGALLPGHGGILDRIDSLLLVIPAVCFYFMLIMYSNL